MLHKLPFTSLGIRILTISGFHGNPVTSISWSDILDLGLCRIRISISDVWIVALFESHLTVSIPLITGQYPPQPAREGFEKPPLPSGDGVSYASLTIPIGIDH